MTKGSCLGKKCDIILTLSDFSTLPHLWEVWVSACWEKCDTSVTLSWLCQIFPHFHTSEKCGAKDEKESRDLATSTGHLCHFESAAMNGTSFQDPIGYINFNISPKFVPLLVDKDLLYKIFVSLRGIKQELHAKSFQVNDIRENLSPHVENAGHKPQTWRERLVTWPPAVRGSR